MSDETMSDRPEAARDERAEWKPPEVSRIDASRAEEGPDIGFDATVNS